VLDQNILVLNTGDRMILFDTGMFSVKRPNTQTGRLQISLKQAGIDPKDIDAVVLTHPHIDHSGGMVADDGSRLFPNAQVYLTQADHEFWLDDRRLGTPAEGSALTARKNLPPLSRPHHLHQGRAGVPAGHPGHADARPYGWTHGLPDQLRRQDHL
jgi:glyoxylase-like metal-dependent hydrolase (beta-lactamase superfamily II)